MLDRTRSGARKRSRLMLAAIAVGLVSVTGVAAAAPGLNGTIIVGDNPTAIALSPGKSFGFVLNDATVSTLNLAQRQQANELVTGDVNRKASFDQTAIGLVQRGTKAYIGVFDENELIVMSTAGQTVLGHVKVGFGATGIAVPSNGKAYVALQSAKRVEIVDPAGDTVVGSVKLPAGPQSIVARGRTVWAGSVAQGTIWVIDTSTAKVVRTISVPRSGPVVSIAFGRDGKAWVSGLGGVSVVDRSGKVAAFIPILRMFSGAPNAGPIALTPSNRTALVINSTFPDAPRRGMVAFVDTKTLKVTRRLTLGREPMGMALDTKRGVTYVSNYMDDSVSYFPTPR